MENKNINYFAEEVEPVKKDKDSKADKGNDRVRTVEDVDAKVGRRNRIIRWVVSILLLGGVITGLYFACFAPTSKSIKVDTATTADDHTLSVKVKGDDTPYTFDLTKTADAHAYYYVNSATYSVYDFVCTAGHGGSNRVIDFLVQQYREGTTFHIRIGDQDWTTGTADDGGKVATLIQKNFISDASIPSTPISFWDVLLQFLPLLVLVGIMVWSMRSLGKMQGGGSGEESIFGIGKSQAKLAQSNVRFSDVAGIEEEKAELIEIVDYLKNPEKYAAMGARTPRGVILYGPPGTGKTLLAKAVAGEARVPFFQVSGSAFEDMLVGVGAKRVRDLFTKAKKSAPSIIFIDELDSVASKRGKFDMAGGGSGLADQTINQLLAEMDGFSTRTGVVVMAATNRLDVLDDAILRPGRFDRHIQVNLPDIKEREAILRIHARNKNLSSKVHLEDVARRTPGFSGAQLENVLNEATLLAVRFGKSAIAMEEIDEAIDRVIAGPAKKSRMITEAEKKQIAYHEAGHALVGLHTPSSDVVEKITIIPRGQAAGYTLSTPEKQEIHIQKKSDLLSIVTSILGGRASEEIVYGKTEISTGAANDLFKVTNIVRSMVTQLGMSDVGMTQLVPSEGQANPYSKFYSEDTARKIDAEIEKIIETQYTRAKTVIESNRKELDLIVECLLLLETIVKNQIDYIHKHLALPQEAIEKKAANAKLDQEKKEEKIVDQEADNKNKNKAKSDDTVAVKEPKETKTPKAKH